LPGGGREGDNFSCFEVSQELHSPPTSLREGEVLAIEENGTLLRAEEKHEEGFHSAHDWNFDFNVGRSALESNSCLTPGGLH
jgi:hypothetical protein